MSTALPKLQWIKIVFDVAAGTVNYFVDATTVLKNFTKLRSLEIQSSDVSYYQEDCPLRGRYPVLSNFLCLQKLKISCGWQWDLEMLSALPLLEELQCRTNSQLTGNLISLRSLKRTLTKVIIEECIEVEGDLMVLADFPRLKELNLFETFVEGDIRDIREHDFPALESLSLPWTVHGGIGYNLRRVSDATSFMQALHLLLQRTPTLFEGGNKDGHFLQLCQ
eukprot:scaffold654_cov148-Skeletonema_menzelii.AAC.4